jgi:hypothetical protein
MHHLDLSGFAKPDGSPVDAEFFHVLRGDASRHMIERAEFRVPDGEGFTVSDITIAGVPITRGSQIAEHITVNLVALAAEPGTIKNRPAVCNSHCCQEHDNPQTFTNPPGAQPCSTTAQEAFGWLHLPGPPQTVLTQVAATGPIAEKAAATRHPGPAHRRAALAW